MAVSETITCDAPGCGKDITRGDGRQWRMNAYSQVIARQPGTTPRFDDGVMQPLVHFCDNRCLANWASTQADAADTLQEAFVKANEAKVAQPIPPFASAPAPG